MCLTDGWELVQNSTVSCEINRFWTGFWDLCLSKLKYYWKKYLKDWLIAEKTPNLNWSGNYNSLIHLSREDLQLLKLRAFQRGNPKYIKYCNMAPRLSRKKKGCLRFSCPSIPKGDLNRHKENTTKNISLPWKLESHVKILVYIELLSTIFTKVGYILVVLKKVCLHILLIYIFNLLSSDKDECDVNNGGCDIVNGLCINTPGSYHCTCKQGYQLKENSELLCEGK